MQGQSDVIFRPVARQPRPISTSLQCNASAKLHGSQAKTPAQHSMVLGLGLGLGLMRKREGYTSRICVSCLLNSAPGFCAISKDKVVDTCAPVRRTFQEGNQEIVQQWVSRKTCTTREKHPCIQKKVTLYRAVKENT